MDLRTLIKMAPAMFRGPLTALLDRLEAVERAQVKQIEVMVSQARQIEALTKLIETMRKT